MPLGMQTLLYRTEGRIGFLTLNRPAAYNAVDATMRDELLAFFQARRYDDSVSVIVLDGGGAKGFCGGSDVKSLLADFKQMDAIPSYDAQARAARILLEMRQAPQPIVACVHGAAAGLGMTLALAADIRVLTPDARMNAAFVNVDLGGADMGSSYLLTRLIGARASEYLLTGDFIDAETALRLGIANRVVPREQLLPTGRAFAEKLAQKNPLGLRLTKEAINLNLDAPSFEAALQLEDRNQCFVQLANRVRDAG